MPKTDKLTVKEKTFVDAYINGKGVDQFGRKTKGNKSAAAMVAYDTKSIRNAGIIANTLNQRPRVRNEIDRLLKKHDLTDDLVFRKLKEGLDANMVSFWRGEAVPTEIPDHVARHKYLQDLLKIMSAFPPERREVHNLNVDLAVEKLPPEEMKFLLQGLLKKIHVKNKANESGQDGVPEQSD